jgi:hypothetical protein
MLERATTVLDQPRPQLTRRHLEGQDHGPGRSLVVCKHLFHRLRGRLVWHRVHCHNVANKPLLVQVMRLQTRVHVTHSIDTTRTTHHAKASALTSGSRAAMASASLLSSHSSRGCWRACSMVGLLLEGPRMGATEDMLRRRHALGPRKCAQPGGILTYHCHMYSGT